MNNNKKLYIAGIGLISAVGGNATMTAAAVEAGVSGYQLSNFISKSGKRISMANIPDEVFYSMDIEIERNSTFKKQYEHIIKMAIYALQDVFIDFKYQNSITTKIPLILAFPESEPKIEQISPKLFIKNVLKLSGVPVDENKVHRIHGGRAAGLQCLDLASRYLHDQNEDFVLVGGSDSYRSISLINNLEEQQRLLFEGQSDGFCPGEASCFLLLTRHSHLALQKNDNIVALHTLGKSEEKGHTGSELPYKGDGLDKAFKQALANFSVKPLDTVYSSMNGESFWAKEYGVAMMRNKSCFSESVIIQHPADCIGDVGCAMGSSLIALSALSLLKDNSSKGHLVYSSSDGVNRAAVIVEKLGREKIAIERGER